MGNSEPKSLSTILSEFGDVDNNFFLNGYHDKKHGGDVTHAAQIYSPKTGRTMEIYTTEPCIQIYTGKIFFFW